MKGLATQPAVLMIQGPDRKVGALFVGIITGRAVHEQQPIPGWSGLELLTPVL